MAKQTPSATPEHTSKGTLSLCMIVRNEEQALPKCLESVKGLVDELIVVDTGSTDATVDIAKRFGAKVYTFAWIDDFSAARNVSLKYATGDWILWLDADDVLPRKYHATIRRLLSLPKDHAFYFRLENVGGDESVCYQLRLFPNLPGVTYVMPVHEQALPSLLQLGVTKMVKTDISVIHAGYTDPQTIAAKNAKYLKIMERWLETRPDDYITRSHVARIYHTDGRHAEAAREYAAIVGDAQCRSENELIYLTSLIFLGRAQLNLQQYAEAIRAFEQSLEIEKDYDIAWVCLGEAYTMMNAPDEAIAYLERIRARGGIQVSFLPVEIKSLNYHTRYFLGKNYERKARFDEAIAEYEAAMAIDARRVEAPTALSYRLVEMNRFGEAEIAFGWAIEVYRKNRREIPLDLLLGHAFSAAHNARPQVAFEAYQQVFPKIADALPATRENQVERWIDLGRLLFDQGWVVTAMSAIKTAAALDANAACAAEALADIMMRLERYGVAQTHYERALQLAPHRYEIFFKLGDAYLKQDATEAARACYDKGLEANL